MVMGVSSMGSLRLYNGGGRHRIGGLSVCITLSILTTELSHHVRLFVCLFVCVFVSVCLREGQWSTGTLNIGGMVYLYIIEGETTKLPHWSLQTQIRLFPMIAFH